MATSTSRTSGSLLPSDSEPPNQSESSEGKTVTVDLPARHLEWLEEKADARDVSLSKVVRFVLKAETGRPQTSKGDAASGSPTPEDAIFENDASEAEPSRAGIFGDGAPSETHSEKKAASDKEPENERENETSETKTQRQGSLLDELKQAKERLSDMVDDGAETRSADGKDTSSEKDAPKEPEHKTSGPSPLEEGMAVLDNNEGSSADVSVENTDASPDSMFDVPDDDAS